MQCSQRQSHPVTLQGDRKFSPRCILDEGHSGQHRYGSPKEGDKKQLERFLANRSERGMM